MEKQYIEINYKIVITDEDIAKCVNSLMDCTLIDGLECALMGAGYYVIKNKKVNFDNDTPLINYGLKDNDYDLTISNLLYGIKMYMKDTGALLTTENENGELTLDYNEIQECKDFGYILQYALFGELIEE